MSKPDRTNMSAKRPGHRNKPDKGCRCCWLNPNQRQCRRLATKTKIIFADPQGMSRNQWFNIPVCERH